MLALQADNNAILAPGNDPVKLTAIVSWILELVKVVPKESSIWEK